MATQAEINKRRVDLGLPPLTETSQGTGLIPEAPEPSLITAKVEAAKKGEKLTTATDNPNPLTQAEHERARILREEEQRTSTPFQLEEAGRVISDAESQKEAARINREKRRQELLTGKGEIGKQTESQVDAAKSAISESPEGVSQSGTKGIGEMLDITGKKAVEQGIASDVEMNRLNSIEFGSIAKINKIQEAVRNLKVGEARQIEDFQLQLSEELENIKSGIAKQDTDKLYDALSPETLSAISENPDAIQALLSAFPNATVDEAQILGLAKLQGIVNEFQDKKVLTPQEQIKLDTAREALATSKQKRRLAGQTEADKALAGTQALQTALDSGQIDQATFDSLSSSLGFTQEELTPLQKAQARKANAEAEKIEVKNLKKSGSSVSNGSNKVNPIDLTPNFDFGTGDAGQNVTDKDGNVVARITSPFGADHSKISGETIHKGVDMVFNDGKVLSLTNGVIYNKGYDKGYGSWVQVEDQTTGDIMQYGHMNENDISALKLGDFLSEGAFLGRNETEPSKWGSSTGAHTDYRFAGVNTEGNEDLVVKAYATDILDGQMKISNVTGADQEDTAELRENVILKVNEMKLGGYKSKYPILTPVQLELINKIGDDYRAEPAQRDMLDVKSGFQTVKTLYGSPEKRATATGFDDIANINAFQRMIDPGATVREGDVVLLEKTIPFLKRISPTFKWSQFTKGDKLPIVVRESMLRVAKEVYNEKATNFNGTVADRYQRRAEASNVDFSLIGDTFTIYGEEGGEENEAINSVYDSQIETIQQELNEINKQIEELSSGSGSGTVTTPNKPTPIKLN